MEDLFTEIEKSFFDEPVVDLAIDYLDIGLDMITNSEIIEAIPVVKTFVSLHKGVMSIKERVFAKKLLVFASEINSGQVSNTALSERRIAIGNNEKWIKKEIEEITVFLDRFDFVYKSSILAKLYIAFINEKISSDKYLNMLPIIDRWQKYDNSLLERIYKEQKNGTLNISHGERNYVIMIDVASKQRLESLGILKIKREVVSLLNEFEGLSDEDIDEILEEGEYCLQETFELNYEGIILAEILFEGKVLHDFDENYFNLSSM